MQFYKTETNFNIDLNKDGDIGFDNKDPVRTSGSPLTYTVKTGEDFYFNQWDLLDGYTDPEGHYLFIENLTADSNGYITTIYEGEWILSSHNSNFEGDIVLSYTVADEFGGSVDGTITVTFKPPSYTTIESQGNITLLKDDDTYGYAQDAQGNKTAITYFENTSARICGKDGTYLAAENINGVNSVIWRYDDPYWIMDLLPSG